MKRKATLNDRQLALALEVPAIPAPRSESAQGQTRSDRRRRIALGHEQFDYRLRRTRRRSIGLQIDDGGLTVSAPRWVTLAEIETAIIEKQRWIRAKIAQWQDWRRGRRLHEARWACGGVLPFLGAHITLRVRTNAASTELCQATGARELHVSLPAHAGEAQVRDAVQAWLQAQARCVFGERIERLTAANSTRLRGWSLSSARSQWGSCTHDGRIRLNWRLIHFSLPVIDYVIAHELAHLSEMNHGARFWKTVGELLPGFEAARDEIKGVDISALPA